MSKVTITPSVEDLLLHAGHVIEVYEYVGSAVIACDTCQALLVEVWKDEPSQPKPPVDLHADEEHSYEEAAQALSRAVRATGFTIGDG
ncbi:MAG: hypothetical protein DRJ50_12745 [Actinobacteria bacterium]|nr:MAG: hypothetical protein DRJ50_12745 [Actinomycetota bacterium]